MWDFVVKYWVEFALGLVASGLGLFCKHLMAERKRYKALAEAESAEEANEVITDEGADDEAEEALEETEE